MQTFRDMNVPFLDSVKHRKNQLLQMLQNSFQSEDIYTIVAKKSKKLEDFLNTVRDTADSAAAHHPAHACRLEAFQPAERRVQFHNLKPSQICFADYLAFRFYDLYVVNPESVERYVHFEIYFDKSILSVLMKKSAYNTRSRTFPEFDLDSQEWAQMKLQMQLWNQWYRPIVKTVDTDKHDARHLLEFFREKKYSEPSYEKSNQLIELLQKDNAPWELAAWLVMIQLQRLASADNSLILLNLKCQKPEEIAEQLQRYISSLSFQSKQPNPEDIFISTQKPSSVHRSTGEPQIYLAICQDQRGYKKYIQYSAEFQSRYFPKRIPILLGNQTVLESTVWNLNIDAKEFNQAEIGRPENLKQLRKMILYHVQSTILSERSWVDYKLWPNRKRSWRAIEQSCEWWQKEWKKWAKREKCDLIPPEYFRFAAWISVALYDDETTEEDLTWLKEKLSQTHQSRLKRMDCCRAFFDELRKNADSYSRELPGPAELKNAEAPFVKIHKKVGECILFLPDLLTRCANNQYGEDSAKIILDAAKAKGILFHADGRDTNPYRYPKEKAEDGSSATVQLYWFIVDKLDTI